MLKLACIALTIASSALVDVAHADTRSLGDGFALSIENSDLYVVKGKQRARLAGAYTFKSVNVDKAKRKVVVDVEDQTCASSTKHEWTFAHLDARLENWAAYALYKKKDYKGASAGYAKAVKLDPAWRIPAYNLASAHQLAGDKAAAVAALSPWLTSEPVTTYVHVSSDPELAPLLDRPELAAIRTKAAGNAKVTFKGLDGAVYSKERNLIAVARTEHSWGSSNYMVEIEIFDTKTGASVAKAPLVKWGDTIPEHPGGLTKLGLKAATDRAAAVTTMLAKLGFSTAKFEQTSAKEDDTATKMKLVFAKAKLGVVGTGDVANALRGNTQVGTTKIEGKMLAAMFVEDANVVVVTTQRHQAEGCDGGPETGMYAMAIK